MRCDYYSPDEIKEGIQLKTNKAYDRYFHYSGEKIIAMVKVANLEATDKEKRAKSKVEILNLQE